MFKFVLYAWLTWLVVHTHIIWVCALDPTGFISIDCGLPSHSRYTDATTGLDYISDESFIDTGVSATIAPEFQYKGIRQEYVHLRSFPEGIRNCYNVEFPRGKGTKYLIRATFMYGNYDNKSTLPIFDLYLGVNKWETITLYDIGHALVRELIHIATTDNLSLCLIYTGSGTPFISVLELRSLSSSSYTTQPGSLNLHMRYNMGSNRTVRYGDDVYDRIWWGYTQKDWKQLYTLSEVQNNVDHPQLPSIVTSTASTSINYSLPLDLYYVPKIPNPRFHIFMHFAEVELLLQNETREFNIFKNGEFWHGPVQIPYLDSYTFYNEEPLTGGYYKFSLCKTRNSTHPPIINALERYLVVNFTESPTDQGDVDAIMNIKSLYKSNEVKRNWTGDPCAPTMFTWEGIDCSIVKNEPPRIVSLNLSSRGLEGNISSYITDLVFLQTLDLSNNKLSGQVPDSFSKLPLKVLNLKGNNLTGPLPAGLIKRYKDRVLRLRVDDNLLTCQSNSCKKKPRFIVPLTASIAVFLLLLIAVIIVVWKFKNKRRDNNITTNLTKVESMVLDDSMPSPIPSLTDPKKSRELTYSEVVRITNNFGRILGKGGSGNVYHGKSDDILVAVKMLSPSAQRGREQFIAEVKLLMRVHHRNLTALVGYCKENNHLALIYEYMANGDLRMHLSGSTSYVLNWGARLKIAIETAQGLEYMHKGCKPPIIHRDVKSSNILLNENFQAKLGDFGLSKIFSTEDGTHVSTIVAGTPGYLDPEYYTLERLTEKSDVYSFGVVLLEIITGKPAITRSEETYHVSQWVNSMLNNGDIKSIIDPRLGEDYDINSTGKVIDLALTCLSQKSSERPTMSQVVHELKECLALENHQVKVSRENSNDSIEINSEDPNTGLFPSSSVKQVDRKV